MSSIKININKNKKQKQKQIKQSKNKNHPRVRQANRSSGLRIAAPKSRGGLGRMTGSRNSTTNRRNGYIAEDEFIVDINGSVNFATTQFSINPGLASVFPWGNRPAGDYSEYVFEQLEFIYKPEVTGFATQGQTGKVILSFDYDATALPPASKQQAEAADPHVDALPCEEIRLVIDCAQIRKTNPVKLVRVGAQAASTDLGKYDAGILSVSTIGQANATLVGELHVKYRCRLEKPLLDPAVVAGGAIHFSSIAATTANNFASAVLQAGGTPAMATGITLGTNTVVFAAGIPGNYMIVATVAGATSATAFSFSGGTSLPLFTQSAVRDAVNSSFSLGGTTTFPSIALYAVTVTAAGATITSSVSTITGTGSMDLFVISLPSSLITSFLPPTAQELALAAREAAVDVKLARLETLLSSRLRVDSDFDDEECKQTCVSSSSAAPLSSSVMNLIGELAHRANSIKK